MDRKRINLWWRNRNPTKKKNEKELAVHLVATMMEEERCTEKKTIRKEAKKNATTRSQKTKKNISPCWYFSCVFVIQPDYDYFSFKVSCVAGASSNCVHSKWNRPNRLRNRKKWWQIEQNNPVYVCLCDTIESICHIGFFLLRSGNPRFFGKPRWLDSFRFVLFFFLLDVPFPNSETRVHAAKSSNNLFFNYYY